MEPPRCIGPYQLIRRVGRGGMAEVWLARRRGLAGVDKPCALKLPLPHLAAEPRFRKMFLDEARLASRLSHAGIVGAFDVGLAGSRPYLAMEWIDGLDLAVLGDRMRETGTRLPVDVVVHIVGEILEALQYAHGFCIGGRAQPIVHRDVSPSNVLVSTSGEVKLLDFGIARPADQHTSQEFAKGKLRYMAAEQLRGRASTRSDLFAVGAILHELLAGRRFREGVTGEGLLGRILSERGPEPTPRRDVPVAVEVVRRGLLQPDERDRIPTAEAALERLAKWSGFRNRRGALRKLVAAHLDEGRAPRASGLTEPLEPLAPPEAADAPTRPSRLSADASAARATNTWIAPRRPRVRRWLALAAFAGAGAMPPLAGAAYIAATSPSRRPLAPTLPTRAGDAATPSSTPPATRTRPVRPPPPPPPALEPAAASPRAKPTAPATPRADVDVDLRLDFIDWAEVRIGGRHAVVDPRASLRVPAGRHWVRWRTREAAGWSRTRLDLDPDRPVQLRLRDDAIRVVPVHDERGPR